MHIRRIILGCESKCLESDSNNIEQCSHQTSRGCWLSLSLSKGKKRREIHKEKRAFNECFWFEIAFCIFDSLITKKVFIRFRSVFIVCVLVVACRSSVLNNCVDMDTHSTLHSLFIWQSEKWTTTTTTTTKWQIELWNVLVVREIDYTEYRKPFHFRWRLLPTNNCACYSMSHRLFPVSHYIA